ncbi:hypothetical protein FHS91_000125 [Sphingobium xanthum]
MALLGCKRVLGGFTWTHRRRRKRLPENNGRKGSPHEIVHAHLRSR